jgi:hypothetical protein
MLLCTVKLEFGPHQRFLKIRQRHNVEDDGGEVDNGNLVGKNN